MGFGRRVTERISRGPAPDRGRRGGTLVGKSALALLCVAFGLLSAPLAWADAPSAGTSYEWERTQRVLDREGLSLAPEPEGKRIAWVRIVSDDVFVQDELWPLWLNWFHATTRESVVRRELLFRADEPFRDALAEETMRNLRGMGIFTLARIVAVATPDPNAVGVLVYTRDIWSLRFEQAFNVTTQINELLLRVTERNLFGYNKTVGLDFYMIPKTYMVQPFYYARRVFNSRVSLRESVGVLFNKATRETEGSVWSLSVGEPFYNLAQRYAYSLDFAYDNRVLRRLENGDVRSFQAEEGGPSAKAAFRQKSPTASLWGYLRRGEAFKQTLGAGWDYREVEAFHIAESALPADLREAFYREVLPRQRREIGPAASYEIWMPRYATFLNLGSFGQSENVRVGPSALVSVRAPLDVFGSNTNSWVLSGSFGVVLAPRGGLLEFKTAGRVRYEEQKLVDQLVTGLARAASPVLGYVRLVARGSLELRRRDTTRSYVSLGADNGLRGYTSQRFSGYGVNRMLGNFEVRTLPFKWHSLHVGAVAFYDVGSVFAEFRDMRVHHAMGLGLRFLFPQFSRYPFSADGGFSNDPDFRFLPTFASSQVVPMTAYEDALQ